MARFGCLSAFAVFLALAMPAQQNPPPPAASGQSTVPAPSPSQKLIPRSREERERTYRAEHHIILNVLVTDASGKPVTGLRQEDFTLQDDGEPRQLASFRAVKGSAADLRDHAMLVMDTVNNTTRNLVIERREVVKFLGHRQGRLAYPISIAMLSASGLHVGQPSRDGNALIGELKSLSGSLHMDDCADSNDYHVGSEQLVLLPGTVSSLETDSREGVCLNRSFQLSVSSLNRLAKQQADVAGRVIVIWMGPGWPLLSGPEFRPDTPAEKKRFFDYLVDISTSLREAQVTLDNVSSPELFRNAERRSDSEKALSNGVTSEDQASAAGMSLRVLARQSGGQVLDEDRDIAGHIAACLADAESYYVLSFDSAPAARPGEHRSLQVKVNKPGLTARTNTLYYAQP